MKEETHRFKITSVTTQRLEEKEGSKLIGLASVVVENCFAIEDIRIIDGDKGMFIAFPSRKQSTGEFKDVCHPINTETRKKFEEVIFSDFNNKEEE